VRRSAALSRLVALGLIVALGAIGAPAAPAAASGAAPRTTLPTIERQVMCVTCKIPLNVAQSTQADRERAFIQGLINQGEDEAEIKQALVGQYGPAVLGLPGAHGFDLAAYLVPLAALLGVLGLLAVLLPRWRRSARAQALSATPESRLGAADAARLESDLSRFD
jgi:cytochrome c-type biogenesis protein CcmH